MPNSNPTSINVNINDVLSKPYGLIGEQKHSFAEALEHFGTLLKSVPSQKAIVGHQLKLIETGKFLIELKAQIPATKQYSKYLADCAIGKQAVRKWGKANASTELSKLAILASQYNTVVKFIEDNGTSSLSATGILKAYNAFAAKNDLPKAEGTQRSKPKAEQPKADKQTKSETGNSSESQPKAEAQSAKTDKPVAEQTVKSDTKPSLSAIAEQLVNTIQDTMVGYSLTEEEESEVLTKLLAAFDRDYVSAEVKDFDNVTVMAKAMNKAKTAAAS